MHNPIADKKYNALLGIPKYGSSGAKTPSNMITVIKAPIASHKSICLGLISILVKRVEIAMYLMCPLFRTIICFHKLFIANESYKE